MNFLSNSQSSYIVRPPANNLQEMAEFLVNPDAINSAYLANTSKQSSIPNSIQTTLPSTETNNSPTTLSTLPISINLPDGFDNLLANTITEADKLRQFCFKRKRSCGRGGKRKRGPETSVVRFKMYHVPTASVKPSFNNGNDKTVISHVDCGYGYPQCCYDPLTRKIKKTSVSICLNKRQFKEILHEMFKHLDNEIKFFVLAQGHNAEERMLETPADIKSLHYNGVLLVVNAKDVSTVSFLDGYNSVFSVQSPVNTSIPLINNNIPFTTHEAPVQRNLPILSSRSFPDIQQNNTLLNLSQQPIPISHIPNHNNKSMTMPAASIVFIQSTPNRYLTTPTLKTSTNSHLRTTALQNQSLTIVSNSNTVTTSMANLSTATTRSLVTATLSFESPASLTQRSANTYSSTAPRTSAITPYSTQRSTNTYTSPAMRTSAPTTYLTQRSTNTYSSTAPITSATTTTSSRRQSTNTFSSTTPRTTATTTQSLAAATLSFESPASPTVRNNSSNTTFTSSINRSAPTVLNASPPNTSQPGLFAPSPSRPSCSRPPRRRHFNLSEAIHQEKSAAVDVKIKYEGPLLKAKIPLSTDIHMLYDRVERVLPQSSKKVRIFIEETKQELLDKSSDVRSYPIKEGTVLIVKESEELDSKDTIDLDYLSIQDTLVIIRSSLLDKQELIIRRENIVHDALEQFGDLNPLQNIFVKFEDEKGYDADGLTRGFFSDFWEDFMKLYAHGYNLVYFNSNPNNMLTAKQYQVVGSILMHGLVICNFLPTQLNKSILISLILDKVPSDKVNVESFLSCLDETDNEKIKQIEKTVIFGESEKLWLSSFLSNYECTALPSAAKFSKSLKSLSKYVLLIKPYFVLHNIKAGISKVSNYLCKFEKYAEDDLIDFCNSLLPTGEDIVKALRPEFSEREELRIAEERSFSYLENCIMSFGNNQAITFMKFISGAELA